MKDSPFVLVVDDDPRIAAAAALSLRSLGCRTLLASDALEAVALARMAHPDAILMDVMMPGLEGSLAAALIRDSDELRMIPVVLFSAMPQEELAERAAAAGAAAYVCKPFRKEDLLRAMNAALRLRCEGDAEVADVA